MKIVDYTEYSVNYRTNCKEIPLYRGVDDFIGNSLTVQLTGLVKRLKNRYLIIK